MILLRLLKNNRAGGIFFIGFLMVLLWINAFLDPVEPRSWTAMPFYEAIFGSLEERPLASAIVAFVFYLLLSVLLVRLNARYFLIRDRSYMPAAMFLLIAGAIPELQQTNPLLVGSLFFLVSINILFDSQDDRPDSYRIFNAALVLGAGSLFYAPLVWFIPLLWLTIMVIRPIRWREWLYPLVAFGLVGLFIFTYYWVFRDDPHALGRLLRENLAIRGSLDRSHPEWAFFFGFLLFLIFRASIYILRRYQVRKIYIRKLYQVFFFMFVFSLVFYFFIARFRIEVTYFFAIPVAYLLSNYLHQRRNHWTHEALLWIWVGFAAYLHLA